VLRLPRSPITAWQLTGWGNLPFTLSLCRLLGVAARPTQCRTFPWWPQHLVSDYDWQLAAADCEGIHVPEGGDEETDVPVYSFDDVMPETILHDVRARSR
jgi:hypothetical protein